jgi:hypothetical protein
MTRSIAWLAGLLSLPLASAAAWGQTPAGPVSGPRPCSTDVDSTRLAWKAVEGEPGRWQSTLWGDPAEGAYAALEKWPAGGTLRLSAERGELRCLVVAGTPGLRFGRVDLNLARGSTFTVFAAQEAESTCREREDCVLCVERAAPRTPTPSPAPTHR